MKKTVSAISTNYIYDPSHKGAPYSFDGVKWFNNGELIESLVKASLGYASTKDANTPYDKGSDIEEIRASVKSSKATLVNMQLGKDKKEFLDTYFANTHSENFIWGMIIDENLVTYTMNAVEFRAFCENFANMNERKVLRFKASSGKMVQWFESWTI